MTDTPDIPGLVERQRQHFQSGATLTHKARLTALDRLADAVRAYEERLSDALHADLGKCAQEAYLTEVGFSLHDIAFLRKRVKKWMRPRRVKTALLSQPGSSRILSSPKGVTLVISPFNYPVNLALGPLAVALAAGNTVVLKTSELTPTVSTVIGEMLTEFFDPELVVYVPGAVPETTALLAQKSDHIFFTGSPRVGRIVMSAAAKNLTPVTLELGGKSPCIVHSDAKLEVAARRVAYGKYLNAGQTCVAPDFLLVHESVEEEFVVLLKQQITEFFGPNPQESSDFGRIVSAEHTERLARLLGEREVEVGGEHDVAARYFAPTVVRGVAGDDALMSEEIFGPILPVLTYRSLDEAREVIATVPQHPLALYVFSSSKAVQDELLEELRYGGACVNNCILHLANPYLPFGGAGESGMGRYHGEAGFREFSHEKSVLKTATWFDLSALYPPYSERSLKLFRWLLK